MSKSNISGVFFAFRFFYIALLIGQLSRFAWLKFKVETDNDLLLQRKRLASQIRQAMVHLGVTFIKLGQFLSLRRDFLPDELVDELSLLQDQVPPFAFDKVRLIAKQELEAELETIFRSFEKEPIASASIGQVHRAQLIDGTAVAVKVQRPNIRQSINYDLTALRFVIQAAQFLRLQGDWPGWLSLINEFGNTLFIEMDYLQEGRHADRLRQTLRRFPAIIVPHVFWRYSTKRLITEELCEGTKIDRLQTKQIDLKHLSRQLVNAYLEQIIIHGYFHADPHAGNLAVNDLGQIIIYDYGMIGEISDSQRYGLIKAAFSIAGKDINAFIEALELMGILDRKTNEEKEYLTKIIQPFMDYYHQSAIAEIDLSQLEKEIEALLTKQPFKLPANLAYLIRAFVALEGVTRQLNPDFNFIRAIKPYLKRI